MRVQVGGARLADQLEGSRPAVAGSGGSFVSRQQGGSWNSPEYLFARCRGSIDLPISTQPIERRIIRPVPGAACCQTAELPPDKAAPLQALCMTSVAMVELNMHPCLNMVGKIGLVLGCVGCLFLAAWFYD